MKEYQCPNLHVLHVLTTYLQNLQECVECIFTRLGRSIGKVQTNVGQIIGLSSMNQQF
jgi:hypothetical protein